MSRRLKPIEWETNSIRIDFGNTPESPLAWALKAISEYKTIPATLTMHTKITSEVTIPDLFLRDSKGEFVKPNNSINVALDLVNAEWNTLILWVAKERFYLFSLDDGPLPEVVMRIHEPRARLVLAELDLWNAIYDASSKFKTALPYDNRIEAWKLTQLESKRQDFSDIFVGGQRKKISDLVKLKKNLIDVNPRNPFSPDDRGKTHYCNMIAAALSIVVKHPEEQEQDAVDKARKKFRREAWNHYLNAMGEYIRYLRDGVTLPDGSVVKPKTVFINKEGELMIQEGRQAVKIWSILERTPKKNLSKRGKYLRK